MKPEEVDNLLENPPKDAMPPLRFFQSLEFAGNVRMCDAKGRYWFVHESADETEWCEGDSGVSPDTWLSQPDVWKEVYPPKEVHAEGDPIATNRTKWEGKIETLEKALDIAAKNYDDADQRASALAEERAELQAEVAKAKEDRTIVRNQLAESNRQFNVLREHTDRLEAQLQDAGHVRAAQEIAYEHVKDERDAAQVQRDTAEAALAQTHEFEVAGKLHKVHHSDLVAVLQQMMELAEERKGYADRMSAQLDGAHKAGLRESAENRQLRQQLKAIRTMSKVV